MSVVLTVTDWRTIAQTSGGPPVKFSLHRIELTATCAFGGFGGFAQKNLFSA